MTNPQLTASSELLSNYKAATIMPADQAFSALQTEEGHSLLFSVGNDSAPYLTREAPGTRTGWQKTNLGSTRDGVSATKMMTVAQNKANANVHLALAGATSGDDALFLSLGNSASDTSWTGAPVWTAYPFDDTPLGSQLVINDIFISEASDGEHIVVDIVAPGSAGAPELSRYFIDSDPAKPLTGKTWNKHELAASFDPSTAQSALGRRTGDSVDGIYTLGTAGELAQLTFRPLYSSWDPTSDADPNFLTLPGQAVGTAMAAVRGDNDYTDLFVAAGQSIYYFAPDQQDGSIDGLKVLDDPMFQGIKQLYGFRSTSEMILWGLNATNQVFYTRCALADIVLGPWSAPLPLRSGVHRIAPYVNRANDGNSFFAHTGDLELKRAVQAPDTTTWNYHDIQLDPPDGAKATRAGAFTTRLQLNDSNGQPMANAAVQIAALHRVGLDINGFYQILDTTPAPFTTDANGGINIVEWVATPRATPLRVTSPDGAILAVNPMDKVLKKATQLSDGPSLKAALVPNKDGTTSTRTLVPSGPDAPPSDHIDTAAKAFAQLATIFPALPADGSVQTSAAPARAAFAAGGARRIAIGRIHTIGSGPAAARHAEFSIIGDLGDAIESVAGDVLSALEHAADVVVSIAEEAGGGVWHFLATIGEQTYSFVLDAAEKVVGAIVAIYNAIKTAIEDLIAWLEFLLEWKHFILTKKVCKHLLMLSLDYLRDNAGELKAAYNQAMDAARLEVDTWANVKATATGGGNNWTGNLTHSDQPLGFIRTLYDMSAAFTSPAMYVYHHYVDHVLGTSGDSPPDGADLADLLAAAAGAVENNATTWTTAIANVQAQLVSSDFSTASLEDILKQLTATVVDALLNGEQEVIDALLDLFAAVLPGAVAWIDQPIRIPVVSDILEDVFDVHLDFSWLDFIVLVGAIPASLLYHAAEDSWPFSDDDPFTQNILNADSIADLARAYPPPAQPMALARPAAGRAMFAESSSETSVFDMMGVHAPEQATKTIYIIGHVLAGVAAMVNCAVIVPALEDSSADSAAFGKVAAVCGIVGGAGMLFGALFNPVDPIRDRGVAILSTGTTLVSTGAKIMCWWKATGAEAKAWTETGAMIDGALGMMALVVSCYHFYELAGATHDTARKVAICDETATLCNTFGRFTQAGAILAEDPETKTGLAVATAVLSGIYGGLAIAAGLAES